MAILKKLILGVVALAAVLIGIAFVLPSAAHVERSALINAKPATVFTILNGFKRFNDWSPWFELDPNAVTTYEGPASGVGAKMSWAGNDTVGSGSQQILESTPYSRIKVKLEFGGWDTEQISTYTLTPQGEGTLVTWAYDTSLGTNLLARYFGLLMDGMIGGDYEKGLSKLNAFAERLPQGDIAGLQAELVELEPLTLAYVSGTASTEAGAIGTAFAVAMSKVVAFMQAHQLKEAAAPISVTRKWDEQAKLLEYDAGIPVDRSDVAIAEGSEVKLAPTYAGKAIRVTHKGPYSTLRQTYQAIEAYVEINGFERNGNSWEQYLSDPGSTAEAELITHIYWPIK